MKGLADFFLAKRETAAFASFVEELIFAIRRCIPKPENVCSLCLLREKAMFAFINARIATLLPLWTKFCEVLRARSEPLLCQIANQKIFDRLLIDSLQERFQEKPASSKIDPLSTDEANVLRYAAGYIPFKLLKKYAKSSGDEAAEVCQFLRSFCVKNEEEYFDSEHDYCFSFESYSKRWIALLTVRDFSK